MRITAIAISATMIGCAGTTLAADGPAAAANQALACVETVANRADFAPIRSKVFLGAGQSQPADMLNNPARPTPEESTLIGTWFQARQQCYQQDMEKYRQRNVAKEYLELFDSVNTSFIALTSELKAGNLTYGDYARSRRDLADRIRSESQGIQRYLEATRGRGVR